MDSTLDPLNDTPTLPELSFDDLLDESPVKGGSDNILTDPLDFNKEKFNKEEDDILNTPGPKRPRYTLVMRNKEETGAVNPSKYGTIAPEATISDIITPTTPTRLNTNSKTLPRHQMLQKPNHSNITTTTTPTEAVATITATTKAVATIIETTTAAATSPAAPTILNGKNMLTKLNAVGKTVTSMNDFVKIAPKSTGSIITATAAQTSSATTIAKSGNKTAIKATNGQIYYIQKSSSGVPTIRLATPPITTSMTSGLATAKKATTLTTTTTSAGVTVTTVTGTNAVGATYGKSTTTTTPTPPPPTTTNKSVAIQMLRSSDGTLIPLKQTTLTTLPTIKPPASIAATVSTTKNALTLSSAMSTQIACKKIITNSGQQVLVKTALKPSTTLTLSASASTPSATPTTKTTATTSVTSTTTTPTITPKTTVTLSSTTKLPTVKMQGDSHETTKTTKLQKILPITSSAIAVVNNGAHATTTAAATNKSELSGASAIKNKAGSKIVVHGADGKQIVVSNSQLIKLSPKPTASSVASGGKDVDGVASNNRGSTISTGGHLKAIHIPGKSGLQYVRVLPNSKLSSISTAESGGVVVKKSGVMSDEIVNALTTTDETTQSTTTTTTIATETSSGSASAHSSSVKLINSESQKFTVVRTSTGTTKMLLTQSPKNFTPITSKVQKTIVTVPTLRKINTAISTSTGGADSNAVSGVCKVNLLNKQTISDINAQIQRITSGEPETKKTANGSRIVVMPRSMLRNNNNNNNNSNIGSNTNSKSNNNNNNSTNNNNMLSLQKSSSNAGEINIHRSDTTSTSSSSSPKKLYSVLKPNVAAPTVSDVSDGSISLPHPVELKTNAELKSLIICGQARALMGHQQQEQQKAQQMLQKQRLLHQQQQQLQQQMQRQRQQQQQIDKQRKHQQQQQHLLLKQQQQQQQQHMKIQQQLKQQQQNHHLRQSDQQQQQHEQQSYNNGTLLAVKIKQEPPDPSDVKDDVVSTIVRRKHCNCTKSQCLKLYCDCFANGEFCQDCNCKDCFNNLQYEDERQKAIKNCLERNPSAFKPKITTAQDHGDMRLHNKGCNCKRSGCLKNYCECYEAKIPCSSNCRCFGCRNVEDRPDLDLDPIDSKILATLTGAGGGSGAGGGGPMLTAGQKRSYDKVDKSNKQMLRENNSKTFGGVNINNEALNSYGLAAPSTQPPEKQQCNFITQEVIDATIQCMISQADECEKNGLPAYQTEKMVMEELGRCLVEIIDFSIRNTDTSYTQD